MKSESNDSICSLSDSFANKVVVKILNRAILSAEFVFFWLSILQILKHFILWMAIFILIFLFLIGRLIISVC